MRQGNASLQLVVLGLLVALFGAIVVCLVGYPAGSEAVALFQTYVQRYPTGSLSAWVATIAGLPSDA